MGLGVGVSSRAGRDSFQDLFLSAYTPVTPSISISSDSADITPTGTSQGKVAVDTLRVDDLGITLEDDVDAVWLTVPEEGPLLKRDKLASETLTPVTAV